MDYDYGWATIEGPFIAQVRLHFRFHVHSLILYFVAVCNPHELYNPDKRVPTSDLHTEETSRSGPAIRSGPTRSLFISIGTCSARRQRLALWI